MNHEYDGRTAKSRWTVQSVRSICHLRSSSVKNGGSARQAETRRDHRRHQAQSSGSSEVLELGNDDCSTGDTIDSIMKVLASTICAGVLCALYCELERARHTTRTALIPRRRWRAAWRVVVSPAERPLVGVESTVPVHTCTCTPTR